jgi:uncharacterized protein YeaC (DUF1315 family)
VLKEKECYKRVVNVEKGKWRNGKKTWDEVFMDVERGKWRNGNKIGMRSSWIK